MSCDRKIGPFDCCSVVQGDCLELMKQLPDGCVDAVITDPPYNVGCKYDAYEDVRQLAEYREWCREWLMASPRPIIFTPGTVNLSMWLEIEKPHWIGAWFKPNQASSSRIGGWNAWEPILFYGRPMVRVPHDAWWSLVSFREKENGAGSHPCPKTYNYWQELLQDCSAPGQTILDPFCGSGTTLVAAKKLGRHFLGFEISPEYCQIARDRIARVEAQPSLFEKKPEQQEFNL